MLHFLQEKNPTKRINVLDFTLGPAVTFALGRTAMMKKHAHIHAEIPVSLNHALFLSPSAVFSLFWRNNLSAPRSTLCGDPLVNHDIF
jgi:hypothetical protein